MQSPGKVSTWHEPETELMLHYVLQNADQLRSVRGRALGKFWQSCSTFLSNRGYDKHPSSIASRFSRLKRRYVDMLKSGPVDMAEVGPDEYDRVDTGRRYFAGLTVSF